MNDKLSIFDIHKKKIFFCLSHELDKEKKAKRNKTKTNDDIRHNIMWVIDSVSEVGCVLRIAYKQNLFTLVWNSETVQRIQNLNNFPSTIKIESFSLNQLNKYLLYLLWSDSDWQAIK